MNPEQIARESVEKIRSHPSYSPEHMQSVILSAITKATEATYLKGFNDACDEIYKDPESRRHATPASAPLEKYHGIWRQTNRDGYKEADTRGKVCSKFNDPLKNNVWVYFVWEESPPASAEQQDKAPIVVGGTMRRVCKKCGAEFLGTGWDKKCKKHRVQPQKERIGEK